MGKHYLSSLFEPQSVAVFGAGDRIDSVGQVVFDNMLHSAFQGAVYAINPGHETVQGRKAYPSIAAVGLPVDLAIIATPPQSVPTLIDECGRHGVKAAVVLTAGFGESGAAGLALEQEVIKKARQYSIHMIGPNCLGVINTDARSKINASFARRMPEEGSIGFLSQSGALCTAVLDYAYAKHIGFSKFISFGNKADVTEIDLLYYLKDDPKTKVILMYLEEVTDGPGLMKAAQAVIKAGKPVLILKSGRTSEGASAAASHTGSMAGSDEVCDAAFRQARIIRCQDIEEMFNIAIAFAYQPIPKSKKIAIITNAGGPGVLTTDAAIHDGLELAKFSEETTEILKKNLPKTANIKNPVDVIGDARADRYNIALSAAFKDPAVDGVFVILTPQSMTEIDLIAREVAKVSSHYRKPVYTSFMGEADVAQGIDVLQRNKIPHYTLPESMCRAFATVYQFGVEQKEQPKPVKTFKDVDDNVVTAIINDVKSSGKHYLTEDLSDKLLKAYGLPIVQADVASSPEEAVKIAESMGYPVVMKVVSDQIIHKSEAGGVILNILSAEEVKNSFKTILKNAKTYDPNAVVKGILIEQMIPDGEEVILGLKRDNSFGPVIMFGLGGIYVEVFRDVSFRVAPLSVYDAERMIAETKSSAILQGIRGKKPRDLEKILECILRLSQLGINHPEIKELDINPLIVREKGKGAFVADARIMI